MVVELKEQKNGLTAENRRRLDAFLMAVYLSEWDGIRPEAHTAVTDTIYLAVSDDGKQAVLKEWARLCKEQKSGR